MGKRKSDFLEPLTGSVKRRPFATVDIESKDGDTQAPGFTRPFLIGTYDPLREAYQEFRDEPHLKSRDWKERGLLPGGCIDKTMSYLLSTPFVGYTIYAHNGGSFDHLFWLAWLRSHDDEYGFEVVPVQSSIQAIQIWRYPEDEDGIIEDKWTLLDSMKLFPTGLDKMLKTLGIPGKVQHDLGMHEDDPSWTEYLRHDCKGLADALVKFHDLIENKLGGEVGMTAPSTSMKLFRRRFLGRKGSVKRIARYEHWEGCPKILPDGGECKGCAHDWVRRGYYGGRTEMFRLHGEKLHYYDINSSYVAAMRETMPVGDRRVDIGKLDWRLLENHAGFAECTVRIPEDCEIPPLPHRGKNHKLMFPAGVFHGVWSCEELKLLEDEMVRGEIIDVQKTVWFRRKEVFVEMVDELWRLRDKSEPDYDEGLSALAKLMGNALYGKFGMREDRTSIAFRQENGDKRCFLCGAEAESGLCKDCYGSKPAMPDVDCDVWYQKKRVEAPYIIPHIAAHITALARVRIWRFMKQALQAGGQLYYSDTDSIITDVVLPSSTALGGLKDEYPNVSDLTGLFVQPKVYMLESETFETPKVTMKGFPKKLRTKENLEKLRAGEELSYMNLEKVRSLARVGFGRGPQMRQVKKSFKSIYDKRTILQDGVSTKPVVLDEWPGLLDVEEAAE